MWIYIHLYSTTLCLELHKKSELKGKKSPLLRFVTGGLWVRNGGSWDNELSWPQPALRYWELAQSGRQPERQALQHVL